MTVRSLDTGPPTDVAPADQTSWLLVVAVLAAGHEVVVVVGEADLHTADQLRHQLVELLPAGPCALLVDVGALCFCDLSGLDALRDVEQVARDRGVSVTYRGVSPRLAWLAQSFPRRPRLAPVPPPPGGLGRAGTPSPTLRAVR